MKIDVSRILIDHAKTLRNAETNKISLADIGLFYVLPTLLGGLAEWQKFSVSKEIDNISITFFGVFIALLLNIQVAVFGIFQRKWDKSPDEKINVIRNATLRNRSKLLQEINANISYLILVSCLDLVIFILSFAKELKTGFAPLIVVTLYSHFILTLVMIIKRSHALFQKEYEETD